MSAVQTKQRACIVVAILCGAITSGLVWKALHRVDPMADRTAITAGFDSMKNADESMRFFSKAQQSGKLAVQDYREIEKVLKSGNRGEKRAALMALQYIKGDAQFRQALAVADTVGIADDTAGGWRLAFTWWAIYQKNPDAMPLLLASRNPRVVEIAKELKRAG